jgi:ABC-type antimicrobial peptide transport system permease subunit
LLEGRDFRDSDGADAPRVALVNESFARRYFRGRSAIGRSIALSNHPGAKTDIRIVGVVNDSNYETMRGEIPLQVFLPSDQLPFSFGMNTYVESRLPPEQISAAVLNVVRELDPSLPVFEMRTMEQQRNRSLAVERLVASLTIAFGALAALLTSIGLYGILSYSVARRTRELGLRVALGARATSVIWLVVREVLLLLAAGAAVAIPAAMALGRFVESQLYGVAPHDPSMIGLATVLLALVSAVAVAIPTRRAIRIPPIEALRYE